MSDGDTLTGSQVVRVYGNNLTAPFVTLTFGNVEYTPLSQGEGYIEYLLGDNGTATISVDGSRFMSFEVEGIVIPNILPKPMGVYQYDLESTNPLPEHTGEALYRYNVNCINAPIKVTTEYPYILYRLFTNEVNEGDFNYYNVESHRWEIRSNGVIINITPADAAEPCWIAYQGFIIAVFNYTTE